MSTKEMRAMARCQNRPALRVSLRYFRMCMNGMERDRYLARRIAVIRAKMLRRAA